MEESSLLLRMATESEEEVIIRLIDEAANWLRTKGTDQWAEPWPSEADRHRRIVRSLRAGNTWILWDGDLAVATLTAEPNHIPYDRRVWPPEAQREPAVYVCRLVVSRSYAGQGLGAGLLDWAGLRARQNVGARWVRVDVWTTNKALHAYYEAQGFDYVGLADNAQDDPSGALFQKATDHIRPPQDPLFQESPPGAGH